MFKLYYATAAVSLVTHIALEETELPYTLEQISIRDGEQYGPAYKRIHPLSRVPALVISSGEILTETPALLEYLAELVPEKALFPKGGLARARGHEWLSFFASSLHVSFITFFRPDRYTDDAVAKPLLSQDGKGRFEGLLRYVESRLSEQPFLLGDAYSLCDPYALVFFLWGRHYKLPVAELPRYSALAGRVLERAAVRRALQQEGLDQAAAHSA